MGGVEWEVLVWGCEVGDACVGVWSGRWMWSGEVGVEWGGACVGGVGSGYHCTHTYTTQHNTQTHTLT